MTKYNLKQFALVNEFQCLGSDCEDTCCKGWGMQVNDDCISKYKTESPDLMDAVSSFEDIHIMKRDPKTDYCVKFSDGLCSIHKEKGDGFLGDACHFYPRITRQYGSGYIMAAAMSCPEVVRKTIFGDNPFKILDVKTDRIPQAIKDYLPDGISYADTVDIHSKIIDFAGDDSRTPDRIMSCLVNLFMSFQNLEVSTWPDAISFYLKMLDGRLMPIEHNASDQYNLIHIISGIVHATENKINPKFADILTQIKHVLDIEITKDTLELVIKQENTAAELVDLWEKSADERIHNILRKWIQAQIMVSGYPFSGFGNDMNERAMIFAVKYAFIKLALMSFLSRGKRLPDDSKIVATIYVISRFMDHLADPELSIKLYSQAGWDREGRLRALVGDE